MMPDICKKCGADMNYSEDRDAHHCSCTYSNLKYITFDVSSPTDRIRRLEERVTELEKALQLQTEKFRDNQ